MTEELANTNGTSSVGAPATSRVTNTLTTNTLAAITFELVNTNLVALYKKEGDKNTFLVIPTDTEPSGGMTIEDMINDINAFLQEKNPGAAQIKSDDVANAVKDVNNASCKNGTSLEHEPDYMRIKVELRQAFLYLPAGGSIEYAFELDVNISELFPKNVSLFRVNKLSVGVWNTDRKKILDRMNLIDVDTYLK